jgi:predicted alpha/beta superfamily hydrolase
MLLVKYFYNRRMKNCLLLALCSICLFVHPHAASDAQQTVKFSLDMRPLMREYRFFPDKETVGVRGSVLPLRWDSTLVARDPEGDSIYTLTVHLTAAKSKYYRNTRLVYKFKVERLNDAKFGWEIGNNSTVNLLLSTPKKPQLITRVFHQPVLEVARSTKAANVFTYNYFSSRLLPARAVWVYLPPNYSSSKERYPVLYMHDGQNIFDDSTSAAGEWHADEIANALIATKKIPPMIIVGIQTRPADRIEEYTPSTIMRPTPPVGRPEPYAGKGPLHARMLVEEIKPFIDSTYRTLADKEHTGIGGASLGGLMSMYTGVSYPSVFGRLAVVSPSVWWDGKMIIRHVNGETKDSTQRVWLDVGLDEGTEAVEGTRELRDMLVSKGWKLRTARQQGNLAYQEANDASHSESAWSDRFDEILQFLFVDGKNSLATKKK